MPGGNAYNAANRSRYPRPYKNLQGETHGQGRPSDQRRGHQPAPQLGPRAALARHHGRRLRGARRFPPPAPLPPRPRQAGTGEVRTWRAAGVRRQQHPLSHLDQDRRVGARQAGALGAADPHRRTDPVGLRLRRRASQALCAVARPAELQGRPDRPARHRGALLRPDEEARRGTRLDPARTRRRRHADRRRHRRTADDVRTAESRPQDRRRSAGHAGSTRDQVAGRNRAPEPRRLHGRRRL